MSGLMSIQVGFFVRLDVQVSFTGDDHVEDSEVNADFRPAGRKRRSPSGLRLVGRLLVEVGSEGLASDVAGRGSWSWSRSGRMAVALAWLMPGCGVMPMVVSIAFLGLAGVVREAFCSVLGVVVSAGSDAICRWALRPSCWVRLSVVVVGPDRVRAFGSGCGSGWRWWWSCLPPGSGDADRRVCDGCRFFRRPALPRFARVPGVMHFAFSA